LCSIRIVRKVPDLAENFMALATSLLKEKHHGVLISAVQLCTELCKASKDALDYLRKVRALFFTPDAILTIMVSR
jgi:AP-1 complex subunit gamma-1